MTYYNSTTKQFYRGGALKTAQGTIFNPTETTLRKHGYEVYTPPQAEPVKVEPSEMRRQAYSTEVDELVNKRNSYQVEVEYYYPLMTNAIVSEDTEAYDKYREAHDHAKAMYDALTIEIGEKKQEIRARYPNEVAQ